MNWKTNTYFGSILANKPFDYHQAHTLNVRQWIVQVIYHSLEECHHVHVLDLGFNIDWLRMISDWFLWWQTFVFISIRCRWSMMRERTIMLWVEFMVWGCTNNQGSSSRSVTSCRSRQNSSGRRIVLIHCEFARFLLRGTWRWSSVITLTKINIFVCWISIFVTFFPLAVQFVPQFYRHE